MRMLLHLDGSSPRGQWQGRAPAPLLQQRCQIRRWRRFQERQDHLLLRFREAGKAVLQEFAQLWVFLTQAVERAPGLIWRTAEIDTSLYQSANPRGQRGFRCSLHTSIPSFLQWGHSRNTPSEAP